MHEEALTRWQRGWSASRGWTDYHEVDDVTVVRVREPERRVQYVATEQHANAAAHLALTDSHPPGSSWLTIATDDPDRLAAGLPPLDTIRTEWLMTINLADQAWHPVPPPYLLDVSATPSIIDVEICGYGEVAATGRMAVLHTGAVVDLITTAPAHRRRGLARATMTALASAVPTPTAYLSASPQGRPLYESLGWTTISPVLIARTPGNSPT